MIDFKLHGIRVSAQALVTHREFRDKGGHYLNRFDRNVNVCVQFWDFVIGNDLSELAMVKSTLNYFMQAYWKRSSKAGSKIELAMALFHDDDFNPQALNMIARQKNGIQSLEISVADNGMPVGEVYLSAREVIMLDIAIGKAISLLAPETVYVADTLHT
ncbi:MAG TPA: hypothetical protein HPP94_15100 [Desulfuromonadales bacterium]|nr:hypothetical protein [Desulfuromonadales bacterium]